MGDVRGRGHDLRCSFTSDVHGRRYDLRCSFTRSDLRGRGYDLHCSFTRSDLRGRRYDIRCSFTRSDLCGRRYDLRCSCTDDGSDTPLSGCDLLSGGMSLLIAVTTLDVVARTSSSQPRFSHSHVFRMEKTVKHSAENV